MVINTVQPRLRYFINNVHLMVMMGTIAKSLKNYTTNKIQPELAEKRQTR